MYLVVFCVLCLGVLLLYFLLFDRRFSLGNMSPLFLDKTEKKTKRSRCVGRASEIHKGQQLLYSNSNNANSNSSNNNDNNDNDKRKAET